MSYARTTVEQYEYSLGDEPHGAQETFALVAFRRDAAGGLCYPTWQPTDRGTVGGLLGQHLEA